MDVTQWVWVWCSQRSCWVPQMYAVREALPRYNVCMARLQGTGSTRGVETEKCGSAKTTLQYSKSAFDDSNLKPSISSRRQVCTTKFIFGHHELRLFLSYNFFWYIFKLHFNVSKFKFCTFRSIYEILKNWVFFPEQNVSKMANSSTRWCKTRVVKSNFYTYFSISFFN